MKFGSNRSSKENLNSNSKRKPKILFKKYVMKIEMEKLFEKIYEIIWHFLEKGWADDQKDVLMSNKEYSNFVKIVSWEEQ